MPRANSTRIVNVDQHRTQKRRVRAGQAVWAVRVEHCAVVLNFEEEVVDHATRQFDAPGANEPANNEVTIPPVHFIETPAENYIFVFQIEQSMRLNLGGIDFTEMMNLDGKVFDSYIAFSCEFLQSSWLVKSRRQIQHGGRFYLGIDHALAFGHRARQRVPSRGDVLQNRLESFALPGIGFCGGGLGAIRGAQCGAAKTNPGQGEG